MADDLKHLAALAALNDMMAKGYANICTIDKVAELLDINPKLAGDAYKTLHALHCVHFDKMPAALRDRVPELIEQVLKVAPTPAIALHGAAGQVVEMDPEPRAGRSVFRLLGFKR